MSVTGVSYSIDEQSLSEAFSRYGEVIDARIIMDRETGRSRGFGFITFHSVEEASSAIQALDGQVMQISYSKFDLGSLEVVWAANDSPSINDVTYPELIEMISKLKDEEGNLLSVSTSNLFIANSENDLLIIDLTKVSPELACHASDADLVILEGMASFDEAAPKIPRPTLLERYPKRCFAFNPDAHNKLMKKIARLKRRMKMEKLKNGVCKHCVSSDKLGFEGNN
uniref:Oligouridylate-binding protein 1-like n=1 Tax=Cicer arietinum TaxID=3827 RepID=A0A3Q7XR23_CICAR|nr:oligouridylate-binding protein 1-like [Cicer arietinum]